MIPRYLTTATAACSTMITSLGHFYSSVVNDDYTDAYDDDPPMMMIRRFVGRKQVVAANEELELASIHLQHLRLRRFAHFSSVS